MCSDCTYPLQQRALPAPLRLPGNAPPISQLDLPSRAPLGLGGNCHWASCQEKSAGAVPTRTCCFTQLLI